MDKAHPSESPEDSRGNDEGREDPCTDQNDSKKPAEHDCIVRARRAAEVLAAGTARIEAAYTVPPDLLDAMHEARLFRLLLPSSSAATNSIR